VDRVSSLESAFDPQFTLQNIHVPKDSPYTYSCKDLANPVAHY